VRRAQVVSPAVTQSAQGVVTARSAGRVASGAYLPTLTANTSALQSNISTVPGAAGTNGLPDSYAGGVALSMELFTGGRRGAERARAAADLGAAEATDVSQRFATTLQAQRAFFEALRGSDLVDVARARVAQAELGVRYARDRERAGTVTRSDVLRAELELTTGRQQFLAAEDTLQSAAYALGRLVGAEGPIGARRPASLDPRPLALADSAVVRLAVEASPAVTAAAASERASQAVTRVARSQYLPDVRLTGGYNWANEAVVVGAVRPGWTVGVGAALPLFNGYVREDAVTRAKAGAEVARVTALDARRLARAEAARLLGALRLASKNVALATSAVAVAEEDLRVQTRRFRAGISTTLDQLTSELALTQARLGLVAARYNYQVTRAQLEALVGRAL
jgi:outer membrane protein